ncbi:MAG: S-adenosylmethionine decarboxylase [Deltaproteobacteria bacterium]|nr:S-adenosylmethionine decarboxylase [Deltaproteobacteria bacterium]
MPAGDPGEEWVVDAYGCDASRLRDEKALRELLDRVMRELRLEKLAEGFWHTFEGAAGVTGLIPLRESHLAVHTWPERRMAAFNLYCCRAGCAWPWEQRLFEAIGAQSVLVRKLERGQVAAGETRADGDAGR